MLQNLVSSLAVGAGILASVVTAPFVGGAPNAPQPARVISTSTPSQHDMRDMHAMGERKIITGVGSTTVPCVAAAVATREQTIDGASATMTTALNAAYTTRASALASAYATASTTGIRAGVSAAWSAFSSSTKSARTAWDAARKSAWQQFNTAAKACKAPANLIDSMGQGAEISGQ